MSLATKIVFSDQKDGGITAKKLNLMIQDLSNAIGSGGGGTGTGDMLKSTYDTNNNGVVDTADSLPWSRLTGVPTTFPPDATAMLKSVYDTNNNGVADTCDSLAWTKVTGTPATYPSDWNTTANKPATFAPSAHAPSHLDNGTDPLPIATTVRTGSLRILSGSATQYLDGSGNWSTPAPAGTVNPGTWTVLSYATGWSENTTARYRVETNGAFQKVICEGIVAYASGAAALAFTLPAGARPGVARGCALAGYDSTGDVLLFSANVAISGAVTIYPMVRQAFSWPSATNGNVYLDNLSFAL